MACDLFEAVCLATAEKSSLLYVAVSDIRMCQLERCIDSSQNQVLMPKMGRFGQIVMQPLWDVVYSLKG